MQVWCEDRLLGELNVEPRGRIFVLEVLDGENAPSPFAEPGLSPMATISTVRIDLEVAEMRCGVVIDRFEPAEAADLKFRMLQRRYHIPESASRSVLVRPDHMGEETRFSWQAYRCQPEHREAIFDHPAFEPV